MITKIDCELIKSLCNNADWSNGKWRDGLAVEESIIYFTAAYELAKSKEVGDVDYSFIIQLGQQVYPSNEIRDYDDEVHPEPLKIWDELHDYFDRYYTKSFSLDDAFREFIRISPLAYLNDRVGYLLWAIYFKQVNWCWPEVIPLLEGTNVDLA